MMKKPLSLSSILIFCLLFTACASTNSNSDLSVQENPPSEVGETPAQTSSNGENSAKQDLLFESDGELNQLFTDYNEIAEYIITADDISEGNISSKAIVSTSGLYMVFVNSYHDFISIRISDKDGEEECLYPVFRDLITAMDSNITHDEIEAAWGDIQEHYYEIDYNQRENANTYALGSIQLRYSKASLYGEEIQVNMLYDYGVE